MECAGCGRVREGRRIGFRALSVDECLAAANEATAPIVSIAGGEPLLHPEIDRIVAQITRRKRFVFFCSNGIALERSLHKFTPSPYLTFVLHWDGLATTHDRIVGRPGVFETVIEAIAAAKKAGFQVRTNTTVFKGTNAQDLTSLFALLTRLGVDGIVVAPAFGYAEVDSDIFLTREEAVSVFRVLWEERLRVPFTNSPTYFEFLVGQRTLHCLPWSTPTRNPLGWRMPCYLIADRYCSSFRELMDETHWERYGPGNDSRCRDCMVHSGFDASAAGEASRTPRELWRLARWTLQGSWT